MNAFLTITGIFIYCVVGNGASEEVHRKNALTVPRPAVVSAPVYGNALLKLKLVGSRKGRQFASRRRLVPRSDVFDLNNQDNDFIGGPVLFEATGETDNTQKLLLDGGKDGKFYLAARNNMGKWMPDSNTTIVQAEQLCNHRIHGAPVVWRKADGERRAFAWSEKNFLKAFALRGNMFDARPQSMRLWIPAGRRSHARRHSQPFLGRRARRPGRRLGLASDTR
jgi:hypothetical protein